MPIPTNLPRGCSRSRGAADIIHLRSLGGDLAQQTNRLYMLTVRRESLVNKKNSLERRLHDINTQLKEIEKDMHETDASCRKIRVYQKQKGVRKKVCGKGSDNGRSTKKMTLKF